MSRRSNSAYSAGAARNNSSGRQSRPSFFFWFRCQQLLPRISKRQIYCWSNFNLVRCVEPGFLTIRTPSRRKQQQSVLELRRFLVTFNCHHYCIPKAAKTHIPPITLLKVCSPRLVYRKQAETALSLTTDASGMPHKFVWKGISHIGHSSINPVIPPTYTTIIAWPWGSPSRQMDVLIIYT